MSGADTATATLVELLAEQLRPAVVEAVGAVVAAALAAQLRPEPERLLSVQEAAERCGCSAETIRRAVKRGALSAVTSLGRRPKIRPEDLERFLAVERVKS